MPPICIAVLPVSLRCEEREILSVRLPSVSHYASHLYRSTFGKILVVVVTGMFSTVGRHIGRTFFEGIGVCIEELTAIAGQFGVEILRPLAQQY